MQSQIGANDIAAEHAEAAWLPASNSAQQRSAQSLVSDPILQPQSHGTVQVEIDGQNNLGDFSLRDNESCRIEDFSTRGFEYG